MSEKHTSRVLVVVGALVIALAIIFWPVLVKVAHPSQPIDCAG